MVLLCTFFSLTCWNKTVIHRVWIFRVTEWCEFDRSDRLKTFFLSDVHARACLRKRVHAWHLIYIHIWYGFNVQKPFQKLLFWCTLIKRKKSCTCSKCKTIVYSCWYETCYMCLLVRDICTNILQSVLFGENKTKTNGFSGCLYLIFPN